MTQWVLASQNAGKLREFNRLLNDLGVQVRSMDEFDIEPAEEVGLSFIENALLKARQVARLTGLPALADDSGLAVDALGGAPGIYSARYAGEPTNDQANIDKLLDALQGQDNRQAQFVCALALVRSASDPLPLIAQGLWRGQILHQRAGEGGFGYDPIFQPEGLNISAAQMTPQEKAARSHRGLAVDALRQAL